MPQEKIRVGIIGAGIIATGHIKAFQRVENVEVVSIWNRTKEKAAQLVEKHDLTNTVVCDSWERMLHDEELDIVCVATAPQFRVEPVVAALEANIHVLIEEPVATSLADAQEMKRAENASKSFASVNFCHRYKTQNFVVRRILQQHLIGGLKNYMCSWPMHISERLHPRSRNFVVEPMGGLGFLGELGSHQFDMFSFLTGHEIDRVGGYLAWENWGDPKLRTNTSYHLVAKSADAIGISFEHHEPPIPSSMNWSIYLDGDNGYMNIPGDQHGEVSVKYIGDEEEHIVDATEDEKSHSLSIFGLVEDFVDAIQNQHKSSFLPTFDDGIKSLRVLLAYLEADQQSVWIDVGA